MRIAFWLRTGNKYGSLERYIALFAEICKQKRHKFLLINEIENTSEEFCTRLGNVGVSQVVVGESLKSTPNVFKTTMGHIRNWKPDIVQLHFINSLAIPFLKSIGVPLVYPTYHSGIDHAITLRTRLLRQLDNLFATNIFAISERVRLDEIRAGVNPNRIEKIYLGLRLHDFEGQNIILQGPEPPGWNNTQCKKIITIGRFFPIKGMRYVVDAAVRAIQDRENIVWWLVGQEGPESLICNQIIEAAGMRERIIVLGQRNDVPALLHQCYLQVVGSLSEGLGFMALEAAACGVPTIGPKIGGLDEAILDGETGLLVESCSSQALADATTWMIDHPGQRDLMGIAAKRYVAEKFDSEKQIAHLLELFNQDYGTISKYRD